jgi:hypothetical protein
MRASYAQFPCSLGAACLGEHDPAEFRKQWDQKVPVTTAYEYTRVYSRTRKLLASTFGAKPTLKCNLSWSRVSYDAHKLSASEM